MSLVNVNASHNSGFGFTSTVNPRSVNPAVLSVPTSNIQAAAASKIVGGGRINRKKINKISGKYKMRGSKKSKRRSIRRMKSRVRSRFAKRSAKRAHSRRQSRSRSLKRSASRGQKGGYAQYQNNMPNTPSFSTGGPLSPSLSAMANPVPYQALSNCTNCVDNYSHFTNAGFPSKGWH
jgi:hypothetical protein